jgi:uncharacterized protein (DUF1778 family)
MGRTAKDDRFNIRWSAEQRELIDRAADVAETTPTAFVRDAAFVAAQRVLADRTTFTLSAAQWRAFSRSLDRPATDRPRLRRMMRESSVLETGATTGRRS